MSLYIGQAGRQIIKFTLAHPNLNKAVSMFGGTMHAITGGKYKVGVTRAGYNMAGQLARYKLAQLFSNNGNLMFFAKGTTEPIPVNFNGNPITVKDIAPIMVTDALKNPEGAAEFLRQIYISPTGKLDKYGTTLYGSYDCFSLWDLKVFKGINERYFGYMGDGDLNTYHGFRQKLEGAFSRYPVSLAAHFPNKIGLTRSNGLSDPITFKGIFTNGTDDTINHELLHWLEYRFNINESIALAHALSNSKRTGTSDPIFSLNKIWMKAFPYPAKYEDSDHGFVYFYGKRSPHEDRATIAGMLFTYDKKTLCVRLAADDTLKLKVEMLTGCGYDTVTGLFTNVLTKQELMEKFGIEEQHFYAKWSEVDGKALMDAKYWNNIIRTNTEVTAETIRKEKVPMAKFSGWISLLDS